MKKIVLFIVFTMLFFASKTFASNIVYRPYQNYDYSRVVNFHKQYQFVICDHCKPQSVVYASVKKYSINNLLFGNLKNRIISSLPLSQTRIKHLLKRSFATKKIKTSRLLVHNNNINIDRNPKNHHIAVYFDFNKYNLTDNDKRLLDKIIKPGTVYQVEGYTDCTGSRNYNNRLAYLRAKNVANYIEKKQAKAFIKKSFGKYHTLKTDSKSRRVIIDF